MKKNEFGVVEIIFVQIKFDNYALFLLFNDRFKINLLLYSTFIFFYI